jgi:hypothetical protein
MLRNLAFVIATLLGTMAPTLAQSLGPNGGMLAGKGTHQTELVVSSTKLTVYILDHGKVHDTKGVKIKAVIQHAGKTTSVDLVADDAKKFVGKLAAPVEKGTIIVLTGKDDHGDAISARYVLN